MKHSRRWKRTQILFLEQALAERWPDNHDVGLKALLMAERSDLQANLVKMRNECTRLRNLLSQATDKYRDSITHKPLTVSEASTDTVKRALVEASMAHRITDDEYLFTYAEVVEPGRAPQAFGGGIVSQEDMSRWQAWSYAGTGMNPKPKYFESEIPENEPWRMILASEMGKFDGSDRVAYKCMREGCAYVTGVGRSDSSRLNEARAQHETAKHVDTPKYGHGEGQDPDA